MALRLSSWKSWLSETSSHATGVGSIGKAIARAKRDVKMSQESSEWFHWQMKQRENHGIFVEEMTGA